MRILIPLSAQLIRFGIVGLISNAMLYLLYLGFTGAGMGSKVAMSTLFLGGTLLTFAFNKRWTFSHRGGGPHALAKYVSVYGTGYVLNLAALLVFVDIFGFPHQVVQGIAVLSLAVLLFLAQRFWVFAGPRRSDVGGTCA